jgi:hypothetical protein
LIETCDSLVSPDPIGFTRTMIENMLSDQLKPKVHEWILAENLKLPRAHAATLLFNHSLQDWRDLIPRIDLPTLIITGRKSVVPWRSQAWIQASRTTPLVGEVGYCLNKVEPCPLRFQNSRLSKLGLWWTVERFFSYC